MLTAKLALFTTHATITRVCAVANHTVKARRDAQVKREKRRYAKLVGHTRDGRVIRPVK